MKSGWDRAQSLRIWEAKVECHSHEKVSRKVIWNEKLDAFRTAKQNEKQEVGDYLSVCVLNLEFAELKSCFIRNVFL